MEILRVESNSDLLDQVIELGDSNSKTLGHFPRGAFEEYAGKNQILAAISGDEILGYLLYRTSRQRVIIVHLCVREDFRGEGIGRRLVNDLSSKTQSYLGIGLHCRRDYEAAKFWTKLGFSSRYEKDGRGKDKTKLTFWWIDHHNPDLFSSSRSERSENRLAVVIDSNIFYDLEFVSDDESTESLALKADWLSPHIQLQVTDELYVEIDRISDTIDRDDKRRVAREYEIVRCENKAFQSVLDDLKSFPRYRSHWELPFQSRANLILGILHGR